MASTINTKELESDLSLLRDINKEMSSYLTMSQAGLSLVQSMNSVEVGILTSMKTKNFADLASLNNKIKIKNIETAIAKLMQKPDPNAGSALTRKYAQLLKEKKLEEELLSNTQLIKNAWTNLDKSFGGIYERIKSFTKLLRLEPELIAVASLLYFFKEVYKVFDQLDSAAADFRKSMGITRIDSVKLESDARAISIHLMSIGVSAKDVYGSIKAIADEFGSSRTYSSDMVSDMATLSAQFGITGQTSAKFVKSMAMVSGSTASTQKDMLLIAQRMSAAAGVPLDAVMQDVAESSQESYQFLSRNPIELLKAAVKARELGTTLSASAKSSASLLNFTESVKAEMEASVLLGKSMNLQKARELAYHRDIAGLNVEIVKLAKEANFQQLDPFQQDAVAKAFGKTAGEVASMLESDREHQHILAAMSVTDRARYDTMANMNKSQIKNYAELARQEVQTMSNQKAIAAISSAWVSIFAKLGATLLPAIATILEFVAKHMQAIVIVSSVIGGIWFLNKLLMIGTNLEAYKLRSMLGVVLTKSKELLVSNTVGFSGLFKYIWSFIKTFGVIGSLIGGVIWEAIVAVGTSLMGLFSTIGSGLLTVVMTPISWIIAAFAAGFGIGTLLNKFKFVQNAAQAIWLEIFKIGDVIESINGKIYEALKAPFVKVWDWLKGVFLGNSPSTLGLMIVDGIVAVGGMIMNALISPFTKAWEFIKGLPIISHLFGGNNISATAAPDQKIGMSVDKPNKDEIDSKKIAGGGIGDVVSDAGDSMAKKIGAIVDAINSLRDDMKSGVLTANVYLDSQKLDSAVGRRLAYTGTLT